MILDKETTGVKADVYRNCNKISMPEAKGPY